jgi:hypothetical protein
MLSGHFTERFTPSIRHNIDFARLCFALSRVLVTRYRWHELLWSSDGIPSATR